MIFKDLTSTVCPACLYAPAMCLPVRGPCTNRGVPVKTALSVMALGLVSCPALFAQDVTNAIEDLANPWVKSNTKEKTQMRLQP